MKDFAYSVFHFIAPLLAWPVALGLLAGTLWLVPSVRKVTRILSAILGKIPSYVILPAVSLLSALLFLPAILEHIKLIGWIQ